jgi:hypothetical protein
MMMYNRRWEKGVAVYVVALGEICHAFSLSSVVTPIHSALLKFQVLDRFDKRINSKVRNIQCLAPRSQTYIGTVTEPTKTLESRPDRFHPFTHRIVVITGELKDPVLSPPRITYDTIQTNQASITPINPYFTLNSSV